MNIESVKSEIERLTKELCKAKELNEMKQGLSMVVQEFKILSKNYVF